MLQYIETVLKQRSTESIFSSLVFCYRLKKCVVCEKFIVSLYSKTKDIFLEEETLSIYARIDTVAN